MPIDQTHNVNLAGEVAFVASHDHRTRLVFAGAVPAGMRIAKLTVLVFDLAGAVVYRAVWCGVGQDNALPAAAIGGDVPPADHRWDGVNNQGGMPQPVPAISAPYVAAVFTLLEEAEADEEIDQEVFALDEEDLVGCGEGEPVLALEVVEELAPPCAVTSLEFRAEGAASTSRTPTAMRVGEAGAAAALPFVSGVDGTVEIRWVLEQAGSATGGRLELFEAGQAVAVWTADLDAMLVAGGQLTAVNNPAVTYIDQYLTLARAPLRLQLTLAGNPIDAARSVAWTWIAVEVTNFRLLWGVGRGLDPNRADVHLSVRPEIHRQELLILRGLKGLAPHANPLVPAATLLNDDDVAGQLAVGGGNHPIELLSNIHYREIAEWDDATAHDVLAQWWGQGPRLPIIAEITLRRATGATSIAPPAALAGTRVLWDWQDPTLDKHTGRPCPNFMQWATRHRNNIAHRSDDDSPPSTNCHVLDGGKRGTGADAIFPVAAGSVNDAVPDGTFPFPVAALAARPWAAVSEVYVNNDVRYAGKTGVLFQPSRIARDAYRVRAYLLLRDDPVITHAVDGDDLWAAAGQAGLSCAETGEYTMWRELRVLSYAQKHGALPAINFGNVNAKLAHAGVRLTPPAPSTIVNDLWGAGRLDPVVQADVGIAANSTQRLAASLMPAGQRHADAYGLSIQSWTRRAAVAVDNALQVPSGDLARDGRLGVAHGNINLPAAPGTWATALGDLHLADLPLVQPNVDFGHTHENPNGVELADARANFEALNAHLLARQLRAQAGRLLSLFSRQYDLTHNDPVAPGNPLFSQFPGLYIYHFESLAPGFYDVSGSAAGARGIQPATPSTRNRGVFYVAYTDFATKIEVELTSTYGGHPPAIADIEQTAYISDTFVNGAETQYDYEALRVLWTHSAALAVIDAVPPRQVPFGPHQVAPAPGDLLHGGAHDGVAIEVRSRNQARADGVRDAFRQCLTPNVNLHYVADRNERSVFITLINPFDRDRCERVRFGFNSNTLTNGIKDSLHAIVGRIFERTQHRITDIHIFCRNSNRGRARRAAVQGYINALLAIVVARVDIQSNHGAAVFPDVYDIDSLTAHELGHTLFLGHEHDVQYAWRHTNGFNCIMNYTPAVAPATNEYCGACQLGLQGWATGAAGPGPFAAYGGGP